MTTLPTLPPREEHGHKGTFGTTTIVGGHQDSRSLMYGGVALSGLAALRSGVGLVRFAMHETELAHTLEIVPQATGSILPSNPLELSEAITSTTSLVLGVAFGTGVEQQEYLIDALRMGVPTVLDADGLNNLAENQALAQEIHAKCILTPHPKEYERLALAYGLQPVHVNRGNNQLAAQQLADRFGCTVILKGSETIVAGDSDFWKHSTANPALATGGSGDALSGILGGLLAQFTPTQQLSLYEAAQLAVEIHAQAAQRWSEAHGSAGLIVAELLDLIPQTMRDMRQ